MKILIVEDENDSRIFLERRLQKEGFSVFSAMNGAKALESARKEKPDIVISDIMMPVMDGFELCRRMKADEDLHTIPFLFYTATFKDPKDEQLAMELGGERFIVKPIEIERLLEIIKEVFEAHKEEPLSSADQPAKSEAELTSMYAETISRKLEKKVKELENERHALQQSEEKYRRLVEGLKEDYFFYSHNTKGIFTYLSPSITKVLGYRPEDFCTHYTEFLTENPLNQDVERRSELSIQGEMQPPYELEIYHQDGSIRTLEVKDTPVFDSQGEVISVEGIAHDITERKRAEKALRESERKLHAIFDHHYQLTGLIDTEGRLLAANRTALNFTGAEESDVVGRYFWDGPWWDSSQRPELRNAVERAARGEFVRFETTHPASDGEIRNIDFSLSPVRDDDGHVIYIVPEGRDITEIRRAEEGKALLQKQLIQSQKMEAIGTLAGGIAHDFNNILSSIIGFTEISMRDLPPGSALEDNLQRVFNAGTRAADLVKQILTFSRQTEPEIKPLRVKPIAKETLKLIRASLPATIEIHQDLRSDSPISADPTQVHQIIMNLCTNAGHAMRDTGGRLVVGLSDVELDADITGPHPNMAPGPFIKLTVSDSGHGMAPEIKDRIFDPFYTTKDLGEGTGLGLSVVHGIVLDCGGMVTVESTPGEGSTFNIFFPVIEGEQGAEIVTRAPLPTGTERILFVDDEESLVKIGKQVLELLGYKVTAKTSSLEALQVFGDQPDEFDLVITDLTMPKMTGDALTKEMMAIRADMPVILCTGYSGKITPDEAKALGIKEVIMKPVVVEEIASAVRRVLDQAVGD